MKNLYIPHHWIHLIPHKQYNHQEYSEMDNNNTNDFKGLTTGQSVLFIIVIVIAFGIVLYWDKIANKLID